MNGYMDTQNHTEMLSTVIRWAARISGLLLILMVAAFAVGMGLPNVFHAALDVQVEFLAMGLMLTGFLLGWRWQMMGGGLAIAGFIVFCAVELVVNAALPGGALPLFVVPGLLLLLSGAFRKPRSPRRLCQ